jgi:hypothetical protein
MPALMGLVAFLKKPEKNKGNKKPIFTINALPHYLQYMPIAEGITFIPLFLIHISMLGQLAHNVLGL